VALPLAPAVALAVTGERDASEREDGDGDQLVTAWLSLV
jgi:hypothetical protein